MATHKRSHRSRGSWTAPLGISVVTALAVGTVCLSAGPVRVAGAVLLLAAFVGAVWVAGQIRFTALAPALAMALALLVVVGTGLAVLHRLNTQDVAFTIGIVAIGVSWLGLVWGTPDAVGGARGMNAPSPLAVTSVVVFVAAAIIAIHYAVKSATADTDRASSVALWAVPVGDRVRIGVQQAPGHKPITFEVVVREDGATAARWDVAGLASDQTWQSPPLKLTGTGPVRVMARSDAGVVADLVVRSR